ARPGCRIRDRDLAYAGKDPVQPVAGVDARSLGRHPKTAHAPRSTHQARLRLSWVSMPSSIMGTSPSGVTDTARPEARRTSTRTRDRPNRGLVCCATATATVIVPE